MVRREWRHTRSLVRWFDQRLPLHCQFSSFPSAFHHPAQNPRLRSGDGAEPLRVGLFLTPSSPPGLWSGLWSRINGAAPARMSLSPACTPSLPPAAQATSSCPGYLQ